MSPGFCPPPPGSSGIPITWWHPPQIARLAPGGCWSSAAHKGHLTIFPPPLAGAAAGAGACAPIPSPYPPRFTTGEITCPQLPHATVGASGGIISWQLHFGHNATSLSSPWPCPKCAGPRCPSPS